MIVLWVVGALLVALLLRAPLWVVGVLMSLALALSVAVIWLGDLQRGLAPLLLSLLAVGFFLPSTVQAARSARVAPAKRKGRRGAPDARGPKGAKVSTFDVADVPGYELLEKVGSGGMASVFRAR